MLNKFLFTIAFITFTFVMNAQNLTQTIRGVVTDKSSNEPLIGAVVVVQSTEPLIGSSSDENGVFKLLNVPIGRQTIQINMIGYLPITLSSVLVSSGKELVLNIQMDESLTELSQVEVTADRNKSESLNNMATVSARTFSVEETQKFAAAVNDPGRMALSYAGVVSGNDGGNIVSIRGNSPYGLQWRMEGADIPNPNHFGGVAVSGGGISILSAQTLSNSDFFTGAFPAEYGNVIGGVFDLKLRKGNNEKREYTIQAGILGLDVAAEGPFKKGYAGSYLINYRYSTLSLLDKIGVPIFDAVTTFQDLSFNFYLPTKKFGSFQLYGFGGLSTQTSEAARDTSLWDYSWQRYDSQFKSNTAATGLKHVINLGEKTYLQSSIVASGNDYGYSQEKLSYEFLPKRDYQESYINTRMMVTSVLNHKFNAKHNLRTGVYFNRYGFNLYKEALNLGSGEFENLLSDKGDINTLQTFAQWKYRINEQLTINTGIHALYLPFNNTSSIEPRFGARYQFDEIQSVSIGYGLHGQMQPVGVYKARVLNDDGTYNMPNEDLGMNKAHHFVVGYQRSLSKHTYIKTELYYQHLFNIAIGADSGSTLSSLNNIEGYITDRMNNSGKGRNYGLELTLEQFTHNDFYFLLSGSFFNSEYLANDNVWRDTRFNFGYAGSFTAGKEWKVGKEDKNKVLGINIRTIYTGGLRETPIDVEASRLRGEAVYIDSRAYSNKVSDYFRTDLRVSLRRNHKKMTSTLALDLQNATNNKNVFGNFFEPESGTVNTEYQVPLLPVLSYRVEF